MNNEELIKLRKDISKFTEHLITVKDNPQLPLFPEPISRLELVNFIDRGNKVVFDIERLIKVN